MTNTMNRPLKGHTFAESAKQQHPGLGRFALVRKTIEAAIEHTPRHTSTLESQTFE